VLLLAGMPASAAAQERAPLEQRYEMRVAGLACPFCASGIERKITELPGVKDFEADLGAARITFAVERDRVVTPEAVYDAIREAGFSIEDLRMTAVGVVRPQGEGLVLVLGESHLSLRGDLARARQLLRAGQGRMLVRGAVERRGDRYAVRVASVSRPVSGARSQ